MVEDEAAYVSRNRIIKVFLYSNQEFKHRTVSSDGSLMKSHLKNATRLQVTEPK